MEANLTANAASAIQKSRYQNEAAFAVARRTLKAQEQQGKAAVDLVKQVEQLTKQLASGRIDVEL